MMSVNVEAFNKKWIESKTFYRLIKERKENGRKIEENNQALYLLVFNVVHGNVVVVDAVLFLFLGQIRWVQPW